MHVDELMHMTVRVTSFTPRAARAGSGPKALKLNKPCGASTRRNSANTAPDCTTAATIAHDQVDAAVGQGRSSRRHTAAMGAARTAALSHAASSAMIQRDHAAFGSGASAPAGMAGAGAGVQTTRGSSVSIAALQQFSRTSVCSTAAAS